MTASFTGNLGGSVPLDYRMPDDPEQLKIRLRQYLNDMASSLNTKDAGYYTQVETITGQLFLPNYGTDSSANANYRPAFRIVLPFTGLTTGANTVPHGLITIVPPATTSTWHFTRIYGVIEDVSTAAPVWLPIPNDGVLVTVDATNVNITIPAAYNGYNGRVILEYLKQD